MALPYKYSGGKYKYQGPIGPSSPGYIQGTANTVRTGQGFPRTSGSVLGASTGRSSVPSPSTLSGYDSGFEGRGYDEGVSDDAGYDEAEEAERERAAAELSSLNTEYDRQMELLNQSASSLGTQRDLSLSELRTAKEGYEGKADTARTGYQGKARKSTLSALSTAKDVERKNRNVLRGLGILNSSAAGEMLQKPYMEYDIQRANIQEALMSREKELDDAILQNEKEYQLKVASLENNYGDLLGQIETDRRFNSREKADAIRQAQANLTQRLSQIDLEQRNFQNSVAQYNDQLRLEWARLGYDPSRISYNPQAIQGTLTSANAGYSPQQSSIYGGEEKRLSTLGAY